MDRWIEILRLADAGELGDRVDSTSGIDLPAFKELVKEGFISALDLSNFDETVFVEPRITLTGSDFLRERLRKSFSAMMEPKAAAPAQSASTPIRIFVSHSVADRELASEFVGLFRNALKLGADEIRCTSVPGTQLAPSSDVNEQLRTEAFQSDAFIALVTPSALTSVFTMFEIGARWGSGRGIFPIVCRGQRFPLPGPLANIHGCDASQAASIHDLLGELAQKLRISPQPASAYHSTIERIVPLAQTHEQQADRAREADDVVLRHSAFDEAEQKVLALFIDRGRRSFGWSSTVDIAANVIEPLMLMQVLRRLSDRGFLSINELEDGSSEVRLNLATFKLLSEHPALVHSTAPARRFAFD